VLRKEITEIIRMSKTRYDVDGVEVHTILTARKILVLRKEMTEISRMPRTKKRAQLW
jgi:hypothetical protein